MSTGNGDSRKLIDEVVAWLHTHPFPKKKVKTKRLMTTLTFSVLSLKILLTSLVCTAVNDALFGRSHIWHEMHSNPFMQVLGFVAFRTPSNRLGIGSAERSWSDVKMIKDAKQSNLGGKSLQKRAILNTSGKLDNAGIVMMLMYLGTIV